MDHVPKRIHRQHRAISPQMRERFQLRHRIYAVDMTSKRQYCSMSRCERVVRSEFPKNFSIRRVGYINIAPVKRTRKPDPRLSQLPAEKPSHEAQISWSGLT